MFEFKTTTFLFSLCSCWASIIFAFLSIPQQLLSGKLSEVFPWTCPVAFSQGRGETCMYVYTAGAFPLCSLVSPVLIMFYSPRFSGLLAVFCLGYSSLYCSQEVVQGQRNQEDVLGAPTFPLFQRSREMALPIGQCQKTVASYILPSYIHLFMAGQLFWVVVTLFW